MGCDRCGEARARGDSFCPYCGERITDEIPMVPPEVAVAKHRERRKLSEIAFALGLGISLMLTVVIVIEVITAISKSGFVIDGISTHDLSYPIFIITPWMVDLFRLSGNALIVYYFVILAAVLVSVALLYVHSVRPYTEITKDGGEGAKRTPLYEMTVLFAVMLAIEMVYIKMVGATDSPIDKTPLWYNMFSLLSASVWEEMITRFLLIGIPIAVVYMIAKRDRREIRKIFGGFDNFNLLVIALIVISSLIFALAHVTSGSCGAWKVFPTFLFGLIAGYLFVRYGLYAAIAMHFLNDYLNSEAWLIGSDVGLFTTFILLIICLMAIPFIYVYGKRVVAYFRKGPDKF